MALSRTKNVRLIKYGTMGLLGLFIIVYALLRSLNYVRGPAIHVYEPINGSSTSSSTVVVRGQAERITSLSLNGQPISIDQQGNFNESLVLYPGMNQWALTARDQFGRSTHIDLDIFGKNTPKAPQIPYQSTTTPL